MSKKLKIRLYKDGTIQMETLGIKGKKCLDYIPFLEELADVRIDSQEKTDEFWENEVQNIETEQQF